MNRGLAIGGAGAALVLGGLTWVVVQTEVTGTNPLLADEGDRSRVYYLDRGHCFSAGPSVDRHAEVTVLACDGEAHDSEVVKTESFSTYGSQGAESEREAVEEAEDECREPFAEYVAALDADSTVELRRYLSPGRNALRGRGLDEVRWEVACVAWSG